MKHAHIVYPRLAVLAKMRPPPRTLQSRSTDLLAVEIAVERCCSPESALNQRRRNNYSADLARSFVKLATKSESRTSLPLTHDGAMIRKRNWNKLREVWWGESLELRRQGPILFRRILRASFSWKSACAAAADLKFDTPRYLHLINRPTTDRQTSQAASPLAT